jgi:hypothetical protein
MSSHAIKSISAYPTLIWVAALAGCSILGADFDKGQLLVDVSLGKSSNYEREIALADGHADLVIAVRDGKCKPVDARSIVDVALRGPSQSIERTMRMGELTWSYAQGSCDAYGYLYDSAKGLSEKFDLGSGKYRVDVRVLSASPEETRVGSLWIIYSGRAPTGRMFPKTPAR